MQGRYKTIVLLVLIYTLIVITAFNIIEENKKQRINLALHKHIQQIKTHYEILLYNQKISSDQIYDATITLPGVLDILEAAVESQDKNQLAELRKKLEKKLNGKYRMMRIRGVLQYHFVFPNNISFLRMHKVGKFGDDLTKIRTDFAKVNKDKKIIRGFAHGRTAHAFRNVYPIFKNEKYIGAVEISFSSENLQEYLNKVSKLHSHFLIRKDIFDSKAWARDDMILKYSVSMENNAYMTSTNEWSFKKADFIKESGILKRLKNKIDQKINEGKEFALYDYIDNKALVIAFYPIIQNITAKTAAWIVSYEKDQFIDDTNKNNLIIKISIATILLFIFYFLYSLINQKTLLDKRVKEKTLELYELNRGLEDRIALEIQKNNEQNKLIFEQTKLASMGEMIGNIAHQWRQPLSIISTSISSMMIEKEMGILSDENFEKRSQAIIDTTSYLSSIIDNFKNYINSDKKQSIFSLQKNIDNFLHIMELAIKNNHIEVIVDIQKDININGYSNELTQAIINIFNNSVDALIQNDQKQRYIFIEGYSKDNMAVITIKDNAGGIKDDIMTKIFEPYFTTKHQSQGTGLGLSMTYKLIVEGMNGTVDVKNVSFEYNGLNHKGVQFNIIIPL